MITIKNRNDIDIKQLLLNIGYDTKHELPSRMANLIDDYVEHAGYLVDPSYSYVIRDIELVLGQQAVIEGSIFFDSDVIARLLENCDRVAVFLTTIGGYLEETVAQLAEDGLVLQASVLDAIGSGVTEKMVDFVQSMIEEEARTQGLYISQRFSPGYCDWNIQQQRRVFQAMSGDSASIQLTDGCLMLPRKSVSGIIGIGSREVTSYNPCVTCSKRNCVGRRHRP